MKNPDALIDEFWYRLKRPLTLFMLTAVLWGFGTELGLQNLFAASAGQPVLQTVPVSEISVFADDLAFKNLAPAIRGSLDYYRKLPKTKAISFGKDAYTADHLARSMEQFLTFIDQQPSDQQLKAFIDRHFRIYTYLKNKTPNNVLFTGYYEPLLNGSINRTDVFRYPVYSRPKDLVSYGSPRKPEIGRKVGNKMVPYYSRKQIASMTPEEISAIPLAWVDDPVALFFLQIQGSGKIQFDNGSVINVHYLISNGHPYKSIGEYLIDHKKMAKGTVSMQSIREYLCTHPAEVDDIFNYNPRYIFFETVNKGPMGCFNIALTPGRSVALDRKTAPAGALVFARTEKPEIGADGMISGWKPFSRFFLNQDTGSAIKGPGRADIFWGTGEYAELAAGYMKHPGHLYFLVLKPGS